MKPFFSLFFLFFLMAVQAQKEDYVWLMGSALPPDSTFATSVINFNTKPPEISLKYKFPGFMPTNTNISTPDGNLVCYSNGVHIFNDQDEIIQNGNNFFNPLSYPAGYPAIQAALLLPFPEHSDQYVYLLCRIADYYQAGALRPGCSPLTYSIVDMEQNNGKGKVLDRETPITFDTMLMGQLTAVKHGNGRDWWVIGPPRYDSTLFRKFLLTPDGINLHDEQEIGFPFHQGLGQAALSSDGNWLAFYEWYGVVGVATHTEINIYKFDRCSGQLSEPLQITYENEGFPGGVAFSPNNRYLYTSAWAKIYQFDLMASDIPASRVTVAEYDGFLDENNFPTRFFSMKLAPDNKIYVAVSNGSSRYLHTIEQPDSAGVACNVQQHSIFLPTYNIFSIPHHPVYRLGALEGSPCDTLTTSSADHHFPPSNNWTLFPNPANNEITIKAHQPFSGDLTIRDIAGKTLLHQYVVGNETEYAIDVSALPPGIYFLLFEAAEARLFYQKLVIAK